jgi:hypothetical protein
MSRPNYTAVRIDALRLPDYWKATLVDLETGATFEQSVCACPRQAFAGATRCFTRPMRFLGLYGYMVRGSFTDAVAAAHELAAVANDCTVDPRSWTWQHHGHTHRPMPAVDLAAAQQYKDLLDLTLNHATGPRIAPAIDAWQRANAVHRAAEQRQLAARCYFALSTGKR